MMRWGHCLFQWDEDFRYVLDIAKNMSQGDEAQFRFILALIIHSAPEPIAYFYHGEYNIFQGVVNNDMSPLHSARDALLRKLEDGLGNELFTKYIAEETQAFDGAWLESGKYRVIILVAIMMELGATIAPLHLQHVRDDLVPAIPSRETWAPINQDKGFRGPGKRQFLNALERYIPGQPRSFAQHSCHACGKVQRDLANRALIKCGLCRHETAAAWFCDKDCRLSLWSVHKPKNCGDPRLPPSGVVVLQAFGKEH